MTAEIRVEYKYNWTLPAPDLAPWAPVTTDHPAIVGTGSILTDGDDASYVRITQGSGLNQQAVTGVLPPASLSATELASASQIRLRMRVSGVATNQHLNVALFGFYPGYSGMIALTYHLAPTSNAATWYDVTIDPADPNVTADGFPSGYKPSDLFKYYAGDNLFLWLFTDNTGVPAAFTVHEVEAYFTYTPAVAQPVPGSGPTQWATYQYTSNQWLLQGWEIAEDGSVSKIAETQVDLWSGNFSNPNWRLVEHPDGGVALVALRGADSNSSDAIEMSRYGVRNGQFELIATFEIPLQAPGWDLMYVAKDYAYFISQRANYQSLVAPWEIRSLRDLSLVASGDSIHSAIATDNRVSKFPYYTVGNTFWFGIDNTTGRLPSKGLKVQQDGTLAVVDTQGADHALDVDGYYDRFVNRGLAHFPRRDRWAVFGQSLSQVNDVGVWQYELTLLDEDGNTVFVQFPVLDSTYYMDAFGGQNRVGIRVGQVFFDAPVNGTQGAHWFGYAVSVSNNVYTPHRFSGSFTIPNVVDGSAIISTTWQDLGAAGSQHGSYYDPDPPSASREGMVTSSSAMIFNSEDDTFDNYNYNLTAWYHMTRDGTYTRLETVDDGYYSKGWGGHTISTMSSATFPAVPVETIIAPGLTGELLDAGQRFLRGDR